MTEAQIALNKRIENDFNYHKPPVQTQAVFVEIRESARRLAQLMVREMSQGRELSRALTRLEESVMHANAGIARQFPIQKDGG